MDDNPADGGRDYRAADRTGELTLETLSGNEAISSMTAC
jgi:hypothetical protein